MTAFICPSRMGIGFTGRPFKSSLSQLSDCGIVDEAGRASPRRNAPLSRRIHDVNAAYRDSWIEERRNTRMPFFIP